LNEYRTTLAQSASVKKNTACVPDAETWMWHGTCGTCWLQSMLGYLGQHVWHHYSVGADSRGWFSYWYAWFLLCESLGTKVALFLHTGIGVNCQAALHRVTFLFSLWDGLTHVHVFTEMFAGALNLGKPWRCWIQTKLVTAVTATVKKSSSTQLHRNFNVQLHKKISTHVRHQHTFALLILAALEQKSCLLKKASQKSGLFLQYRPSRLGRINYPPEFVSHRQMAILYCRNITVWSSKNGFLP